MTKNNQIEDDDRLDWNMRLNGWCLDERRNDEVEVEVEVVG